MVVVFVRRHEHDFGTAEQRVAAARRLSANPNIVDVLVSVIVVDSVKERTSVAVVVAGTSSRKTVVVYSVTVEKTETVPVSSLVAVTHSFLKMVALGRLTVTVLVVFWGTTVFKTVQVVSFAFLAEMTFEQLETADLGRAAHDLFGTHVAANELAANASAENVKI